MIRSLLACVLSLAAAGAGCKKSGNANKGAGAGEGLPEEVTSRIPANAATAFAGAWKGRMTLMSSTAKSVSMAGAPAAFDIKGDTITVFDGTTDHTLRFSIESPCSVRADEEITEGSMKGGTAYHSIQYVIKDGKAMFGDGGVGFRSGKTAVFCTTGMDGGIYVMDDTGKCTHWKDHFGKWGSTEGICKWGTADGKDVLTIGTGDWATKLVANGDALLSDQFVDEAKLYEKMPSFAEAKSAVSAKLKADDPVEQAKAAGGKAGDTSTVTGLLVSVAADPSLKGKPIELTAQYQNSNESTSNGVSSYGAFIVDNKDSKFSLYCESATKVETMMQWDKVIVKGTLDPESSSLRLKNCTVTEAP